jgi:PAS domain S-box-containing protein
VPPKLHIERELSQAEAASQRAERLGSLLSLSYEPMLVWQLNGPIEFWNTGAERLYGFASEEAIGHSSHALLQTKFPLEFNEWIKQLQNERYWSGELRHVCKEGREVIVESRQQLLSDGTVIEVNRDVTQRKQIASANRWMTSRPHRPRRPRRSPPPVRVMPILKNRSTATPGQCRPAAYPTALQLIHKSDSCATILRVRIVGYGGTAAG